MPYRSLFSIAICITLSYTAKAQLRSSTDLTSPADTLMMHIGEMYTIFGNVNKTSYDAKTNTTCLYVGNKSNMVALVINAQDRLHFDRPPEEKYANHGLKATGILQLVNGKLQIAIRDSSRIATIMRVRVNY